MVGRMMNDKLASGWIPSDYLITREKGSDFDTGRSYLLGKIKTVIASILTYSNLPRYWSSV